MMQSDSIIALDVSKDRLDGLDTQTGELFQVENTEAGYALLRRRCRQRAVQVVLEASGGYERPVMKALSKAGIPLRLVDPRKVRHFARAHGRWAKNDRLDARMIAAYAQAIPGTAHRPDPEREGLAELTTYRRQLLNEQTIIKNQAKTLVDPELRRMASRRLKSIALLVLRLDKRIADHIAASKALKANDALLQSIPAVGPVLAATLRAHMPELGTLSRHQAAALAGVAPMDNQSGKRDGPRSIYGGRPAVRTVLYMAAVVASSRNPPLTAFYKKLIAAGKKPKVAFVALMRKIIVLANAIVRDQKVYAP